MVETAPLNTLENRYYKVLRQKPQLNPDEVLERFTIAERHVLAAHWFCDIGQFVPGYLTGTKSERFSDPFRPYYRHEGFRLLSTQGTIEF